jgi:hypothetical protein
MSFPRVRFAADKVAVYEAPGNNPLDLPWLALTRPAR